MVGHFITLPWIIRIFIHEAIIQWWNFIVNIFWKNSNCCLQKFCVNPSVELQNICWSPYLIKKKSLDFFYLRKIVQENIFEDTVYEIFEHISVQFVGEQKFSNFTQTIKKITFKCYFFQKIFHVKMLEVWLFFRTFQNCYKSFIRVFWNTRVILIIILGLFGWFT